MMRYGIRPTAKSPGGEWDSPAWDRLTVRWAGDMTGPADSILRGGEALVAAQPHPPTALAEFSAAISLGTLDGTNGFRIDGVDASDFSGFSVSSAGDVNGDGFDDIIIGAQGADPSGDSSAGESYVVFGKAGGFAASLDLAALDGTNGFRLDGIDASDFSGGSVSSAGDVNGDGFDDIIIGASQADPGGDSIAGESYVVFGKEGGFTANLDLATLDGSNGFRLDGIDAGDLSGWSVSAGGDVNGDGFDDIIIGAYGGDRGGNSRAGESYVVFGKAGGFAASLDLATLNGTNGFRLVGVDTIDYSGVSVSSAGDVNGDGFDDIIIGANGSNEGAGKDAGESYVVFGKADGFAASFDLATLDGSNGFRLVGADALDESGRSVSSAGDVNGDGFDDIIIGALLADPGGDDRAGESYVVFGKASGFTPSLNLAALDGSNGFRLVGIDAYDLSGASVSSAGDVNGDGFDDIIIGAYGGDPGGDSSGESYVVFGKAGGFAASINLATLDGSNGFRLDGINVDDYSGIPVSSAGDVNGDGFDDIIIGAYGGDPSGDSRAGESYIVFGRAPDAAVTRIGSAASQTILGGAFNDTLSGLGGDDTLEGRGGNDTLDGGFGADIMLGGAGDDDYVVDSLADLVIELAGEGLDTVTTSVSFDAGVQEIETILASSATGVTLTGGDTANVITGGNGTDTLIGQGGDDILDGGLGADNLQGGDDADTLKGQGGNDILDGGDGLDKLLGGGGNDRLIATTGGDRMTGGSGADRFVLDNDFSNADRARITDFVSGTDKFAIDAADFGGGLTPGALNPAAFVINTTGQAGDADDRFIYNSANGRLFFDADGNGAGQSVLIAQLTGAPSVAVGDFLVVSAASAVVVVSGEGRDLMGRARA